MSSTSVLNKPITLPMPQFVVQEQLATLNEYNVAYALEQEGIEYNFRVSFFGGRSLRGGVEVDFVIDFPFPIPLEVYGNYFHSGELGSGDRLRNQIISLEFGTPVVIIWGNESNSIEAARGALRKKLRL